MKRLTPLFDRIAQLLGVHSAAELGILSYLGLTIISLFWALWVINSPYPLDGWDYVGLGSAFLSLTGFIYFFCRDSKTRQCRRKHGKRKWRTTAGKLKKAEAAARRAQVDFLAALEDEVNDAQRGYSEALKRELHELSVDLADIGRARYELHRPDLNPLDRSQGFAVARSHDDTIGFGQYLHL